MYEGRAAQALIFLSANSIYEAINCIEGKCILDLLWYSKSENSSIVGGLMRKSHSAAAAGRTGGEGMKGRPVKAEKAAIFNYMT